MLCSCVHGRRKRGDGGDASPAVKRLGGDVPSRFENDGPNPVSFPIFRVFGGKLVTLPYALEPGGGGAVRPPSLTTLSLWGGGRRPNFEAT